MHLLRIHRYIIYPVIDVDRPYGNVHRHGGGYGPGNPLGMEARGLSPGADGMGMDEDAPVSVPVSSVKRSEGPGGPGRGHRGAGVGTEQGQGPVVW